MVRAGIKEAHPAGIWSDLSVDGPVIGTLIVVLDKAKNLPNRKKIGKQDPYVVARLGKEAKRTDADVRGGQTPRWDKELRFPVRNSPDYKTLKITVFNDDKKTDLIGEVTLRLDKILVKGGGTDDGWRGLKCKEKYAGEILVELTFWDMRPKDEPVVEKRRPEQTFGKEREREKEAPRKVGGAREMASAREKTVKRRPLPSDPRRSSKEDVSQPVAVPEKRTRRSRHSYHSGYENQQHHSHHSYPGTLQPQYRDSRGPSRAIAMAPEPSSVPPGGIYDPSGDNYVPGGDMFGRFEEDDNDQHGEPPPPPPPTHRRHYDASPGHHSLNVLPPPHQTIHKRHKSQHQLKHYQSVPDWQQQQSYSQDPHDRELHRSSSYDPRTPDQFGGSYPEPPNRYLGQDDYDEYPHSPDARASTAHLRQDRGIVHQDESPGLSYGPTPVSSFENFRDGQGDAPPPPPPPHGHSPAPMRFDEPNWGNLKPKTKDEEDLGLPSYELSTQLGHQRSYSNMNGYALEARRPSVGMEVSLTRNGMPIPPSLVPGIDPAVAEQISERIKFERRSSFVDTPPHRLQIEGPLQSGVIMHSSNQNYHRPQVEEVQDVQLYQPQLLPEDQVVGRPVTTKKKGREQRTAPMVKPMPIHGERDDAVPAIGATLSSVRRNSTLVMVVPDRRPAPHPDPPFEGLPFSPDSFDVINPGPSASLSAAINHPGATYNTPQEAEETSRRRAAESKRGKMPSKMIKPGSNRVLDGSDVLPPESFAPEPEKRGRKPRPPPPVPVEYRRHSTGRGPSPSPQQPRRGERLALTGPESAPPIPKKVSIRGPSPQPDRGERERAKRRLRNSQSMAVLPSNSQNHGSSRNRYSVGPGAMVMYDPESERERQRERDRAERDSRALVPAQGNDRYGYNSEPPRYSGGLEVGSYGNRSSQAPPVPAKVPMQTSAAGMSREDFLLSQEMSLINIGPSPGGRTRRGRH